MQMVEKQFVIPVKEVKLPDYNEWKTIKWLQELYCAACHTNQLFKIMKTMVISPRFSRIIGANHVLDLLIGLSYIYIYMCV